MILLVLAVVLNALVVNYGSGGFLDRYHAEGFFEARMRSDVAAERLAAMQELIDPMNYDIWERDAIHQVLVGGLDDPDPAVRNHVVWNAGELEVVEARGRLTEIALDSDEPSDTRAEAAVALGKLGSVEMSRKALEEIVEREANPEVTIGALRGLAAMESQLSTDIILERAKAELGNEVGVNALYALRKLQDPDVREWLRSELENDPDKTTRCALMDTLKLVAADDDVTWARLRFSREPKEEGCEPVIWEERNERQHYILYGDSFRVKFLKIVANASGVEQEAWFQRIVADPSESWRIREVANEVVLGIKRARGEL
jgi:HEAT repeat protein